MAVVIILGPLYWILVWTYLNPKESLLWGKRGMYKEEPEFSEGMIRYTKGISLLGIFLFTLITLIILIV